MKKQIALTLAALLCAGLLAACGAAETKEAPAAPAQTAAAETKPDTTTDTKTETKTEPEDKHPDSIVIAIESEPTTLNPFDHAAVVSGYMNQLTYNRLFRLDIDTLEPVPDLVESYEALDDVTWRFRLKEGVLFHDGTELTAEDVKASMVYARNFTSSNRYTGFWTDVTVDDTYTLTVTTDGPYALILNDLAANGNTVVPKHLIDEDNDFNKNPIGSGPYKFVNWTLGDSLTFVKNEDYFDKEHMPAITDLAWRVIPEGSSRTIALESGEVDLIVDVASTDVERLRGEEDITVEEVEGTRFNFLAVNNEKAPFDELAVRRALNCLVDKAAVIEVAANGQGGVCKAMLATPFPGVTEEGAEEHSVERALALFEQAGVDPSTLEFTCMVYTDATRRAAEVIQGCMTEAGITMHIESLDFAAWLSRLLEGDYELAVAGYSAGDVLTAVKGLYHSSSIGAANSARLVDPALDKLIDRAQATVDEASRLELIRQITVRLNEEGPVVPLYTSAVIRAFDSRLKGAAVSASGGMLWQDLAW